MALGKPDATAEDDHATDSHTPMVTQQPVQNAGPHARRPQTGMYTVSLPLIMQQTMIGRRIVSHFPKMIVNTGMMSEASSVSGWKTSGLCIYWNSRKQFLLRNLPLRLSRGQKRKKKRVNSLLLFLIIELSPTSLFGSKSPRGSRSPSSDSSADDLVKIFGEISLKSRSEINDSKQGSLILKKLIVCSQSQRSDTIAGRYIDINFLPPPFLRHYRCTESLNRMAIVYHYRTSSVSFHLLPPFEAPNIAQDITVCHCHYPGSDIEH